MLANYYKTAVRNIARSRFHAVINIVGLSVGIAFTLLIAAYCWSETRVNHQLRNSDRQYYLTSVWKVFNGNPLTSVAPLAKALKDNYPSLVANFYRWDGITSAVSYGDKHFREGIQLGDSTLIAMYGFPILHGDVRSVMNTPFSVVITDEKAIKYFGTTDVVGKNLTIDNFSGGKRDFRITAVIRKPTRNNVTFLNNANDNGVFVNASAVNFFGRDISSWQNTGIVSYVELQPGVKPSALEEPVRHLLKLNSVPQIADNLHVVPVLMTDYYLNDMGGTVRKMIYTLSFVALFILGMAIINFVNLSVSRSSSRMKEIGIRKVLGGLRRQLRAQFLSESILLSTASTMVALLIYVVSRPFFAALMGSALPGLTALPPLAWPAIGLFALFTGWLAGLYPATLLSALNSIDALKSKASSIGEKVILRKGLVGIQFATATVVFVAAIIVSQQIHLFLSDQIGYKKDFVVSAQVPRDWSGAGVEKMMTIRDIFARMPEVKEASLTYNIPNGMNLGGAGLYREGGDSTRPVNAELMVGDEHYVSTYQIPLAAGTFFHGANESDAQDSLSYVINEMAAKQLGFQRPADALNQRIRAIGAPTGATIRGIVRDFHFDGMFSPMQPMLFAHVRRINMYRYFSFQLRPGNIAASMEALQRQWSKLMPGAPFEYRFMDETLLSMYTTELRLRKAADTATVLCFIIVLLGIVGLVSNSVRRRTKEIAIRKVIGSSATGIVRLFIRDYLPVLLVAGLVASPIAYWLMQRWLEGYPTRITITVWPFVLSVGCLALIMIGLIVMQTVRAALANPVNSLKVE